MAERRRSSVEELSETLDTTMERLEALEIAVDNSPEYAELAPYLRIAIASLRTAVGLYGVPLNTTLNAKKGISELKDMREPSRVGN